MNLGERIKALRLKNNMTLQQVGDVFGITRSAVGSWERGDTRPDQDRLTRLAKLYGTSIEHILSGASVSSPTVGNSSPLLHRPIGLPVIPIGEVVKWSELMPEEKLKYSVERIPCPFPHSEDAFYTQVTGQSMFNPAGGKSYSEGDYIAVDPKREIKHRSVALLLIDGTPTLRQVLDEGGGKMLEALNPAWPSRYSAFTDDLKVLGVVIGKWVPEE